VSHIEVGPHSEMDAPPKHADKQRNPFIEPTQPSASASASASSGLQPTASPRGGGGSGGGGGGGGGGGDSFARVTSLSSLTPVQTSFGMDADADGFVFPTSPHDKSNGAVQVGGWAGACVLFLLALLPLSG
jgi:hypothetical protein